ncbi:MAG: glycoside hydrolase, partial [Bacteroidota bacterium]
MNGVSFVASNRPATQTHVDAVVKLNANYAAVMPFGFIRDLETPEIVFDTQRQWFGETREGARQYTELLHQNNINVMLKPQIWIWRGEFTGYL